MDLCVAPAHDIAGPGLNAATKCNGAGALGRAENALLNTN